MTTETIDKLFLELSQFTTATTAKEYQLHAVIEQMENTERLFDYEGRLKTVMAELNRYQVGPGECDRCIAIADASCRSLRLPDSCSPSEVRDAIGQLETDIAHWVQLAKYQRDWFKANNTAGTNAVTCPTDAAIAASEKLLGREIGYPNA